MLRLRERLRRSAAVEIVTGAERLQNQCREFSKGEQVTALIEADYLSVEVRQRCRNRSSSCVRLSLNTSVESLTESSLTDCFETFMIPEIFCALIMLLCLYVGHAASQ